MTSCTTHPSGSLRLCAAAVAAALALSGCSAQRAVALRSSPLNPLSQTLKLGTWSGPEPTPRTLQLLRVYGLEDDLGGSPEKLLEQFQAVTDRDPTPEKVYALAELAYLGGQKQEKHNPERAKQLYSAAVLHAYRYLFDSRLQPARNAYDPQFRASCELYNTALETSLRLENRLRGIRPGETYTFASSAGVCDIVCQLRSGTWRPEDFARFEFASDYDIYGLQNHYRRYGLGVPLIAVRQRYADEPASARYYPPELSFPVTALVRPCGMIYPPAPDAAPRHQAVLELYDPLATDTVPIGGSLVPLESDLTTPLAHFLANPQFDNLADTGLFDGEALLNPGSENNRPVVGLYMVQPYERGKIPVVFIHGLWSSPMTWMAMFNDLRSIPELRENYQFWFYLYPTGQPFWISAAQFRRDLAEVRSALDPQRREAALDQMVLVGHSMGGLVARLQTIESGDRFWRLVSEHPFSEIQTDADLREKLRSVFFFQANPSVRRVVTIGTPHHGSRFSNTMTQWLGDKLISLPQALVESQQAIYRDNQDLVENGAILKVRTSIDSLAPDSPFLPAMLDSPPQPDVHYHNIIGLMPEKGIVGHWAGESDGVVTLESARTPDAESEIVVPSPHTTIHTHPLAVLEVRRILLEHLARQIPRRDVALQNVPQGSVATDRGTW